MDDELQHTPGGRLSLREVTVALKACNGSLPKAAEALGVDLYRLSRYVAVRPKLRDLSAKLRNMLVDIAEGHFSDAVISGDPWAVRMALNTLGKDRGYTSKQEIDHRLINTTDPTKMSDQQLHALVEERAKQQRIAAKQSVIEVKPVNNKDRVVQDMDFNHE